MTRATSAISRQRTVDSEDDSEDEHADLHGAGGGRQEGADGESGDPWGPAASGPDDASIRSMRAWAGADMVALGLVHLCCLRYDRTPATRLASLGAALRYADLAAEQAAVLRQQSAATALDAAGDVSLGRLSSPASGPPPPLVVSRWGTGAAFLVRTSAPDANIGEGSPGAESPWISSVAAGAWVWVREARGVASDGGTSAGLEGVGRGQAELAGAGPQCPVSACLPMPTHPSQS